MRAIDIHMHLMTPEYFDVSMRTWAESMRPYYRFPKVSPSLEQVIEIYRRDDVKVTPVGWDDETFTGDPAYSHDHLAKLMQDYPDVFIGAWACVDPWKGKLAARELERCIKELGFLGVKFQQGAQHFAANDKQFYWLWEECVDLKCAVQLHSGHTGVGIATPGGGGVHLRYYDPYIIDDIAADFPELTIIALHPSWPWQQQMISILLHKGNVYNDLSGWMPKYTSPELQREIRTRLQDKFLFGTENLIGFGIDRWIKEMKEMGDIKDEVMEKILYGNALRLFPQLKEKVG